MADTFTERKIRMDFLFFFKKAFYTNPLNPTADLPLNSEAKHLLWGLSYLWTKFKLANELFLFIPSSAKKSMYVCTEWRRERDTEGQMGITLLQRQSVYFKENKEETQNLDYLVAINLILSRIFGYMPWCIYSKQNNAQHKGKPGYELQSLWHWGFNGGL